MAKVRVVWDTIFSEALLIDVFILGTNRICFKTKINEKEAGIGQFFTWT